jgi:hypothetical protein
VSAFHPASQVDNSADIHVAGCTLQINSDLDKDSPLLLKSSGSLDGNRFFLPTPQSDVLRFRAKEKVLLACPGTGNNLVVNRRQKTYKETSASCDSGRLQGQLSCHFQFIFLYLGGDRLDGSINLTSHLCNAIRTAQINKYWYDSIYFVSLNIIVIIVLTAPFRKYVKTHKGMHILKVLKGSGFNIFL